jgi:hypothetical protein
MPIADPNEKAETRQPLVRIEVEVPEDAVPALLKHAAALRGEPSPKPTDFKTFLTSGPAWTDEFVELVNRRDRRPGRDIDL